MSKINRNMMLLRYHNKHNKYYSQKDINNLLKIPQTQISRIENGSQPKLHEVILYSKFFDVSLDDLIYKEYDIKEKKFY